LEGKGKDAAEERQMEMRKTIKAVVHCDIFDENPIEKGYEGPYDVVMSNLCLDGACKTIDEFKTGLRKLACLLKPGGRITMYVDAVGDPGNVGTNYSYGVGDSDGGMERFNFLGFTRESLTALLESAGFTDVYINGCDRGTLEEDKLSGNVGAWAMTMPEEFLGFLFVHATKKT
jgi:nicotinamide N-methyltransferase